MVLMLNQVWFPPEQSDKVATRYIEWMKENPPDPTVEKTLCIGVRSTEDGHVLAIGIGDITKGKEKESLINATKGNLFLAAKIPGIRYETDLMLDFSEAYKVLGMTAPDI